MNYRKGVTRLIVAWAIFWGSIGYYGWSRGTIGGDQLAGAALFWGLLVPIGVLLLGGVGVWIWRGFRS